MTQGTYSRRNLLRAGFIAAWVLGAAWGFYLWRQSGLPLRELPDALRAFVAAAGPWGPALYLLLFVLRAATLVPASPFVLAAGLIWGPWMGMLWALIGINLSGWAAYGLARWLGREWVSTHEGPWMKKAEERLRAAPFMSALMLRLLLLPYDPVNFACGLVGIPFGPYAASTALGVLPGTITFSLFGGSLSDPRVLAVSVGVFASSIVLARFLKARQDAP